MLRYRPNEGLSDGAFYVLGLPKQYQEIRRWMTIWRPVRNRS